MTLPLQLQNLRTLHLRKGAPSIGERILKLQDLMAKIRHHEALILESLKSDLGKGDFESFVTEVGFIIEEIKFTVKNLKRWAKPKRVPTPITTFPGVSYVKPEPFGVVLVISPWNYPFQLAVGPLLGAIAAGNKVVLKPSEYAPHTASALRTLLSDVFTEEEVLVVEGGPEVTQELLASKFDYIFFTGSTPIGKIVMEAAAKNLTPVTLELGGKSPCLIDESADLDIAAKRCVWGKFMNAGQTCVAPDYVLVPKKYQDEFVEKLKVHLKSFYGSDIEQSDYSRIINERHYKRLIELAGEHLGPCDGKSKFIAPVIIKDSKWTDTVMEEEIFGPILPVIPYEDQTAAIQEILHRPKPLAFYVFSSDVEKGREIMDRVSFGGGCLNDTLVHLSNPHLPFGGVGASGMGSYHGEGSFKTFSHFKAILEQSTKVDIPMRYPPYGKKLRWLKFLFG
jgi:aldehyde dehydrogenase (NAD+)